MLLAWILWAITDSGQIARAEDLAASGDGPDIARAMTKAANVIVNDIVADVRNAAKAELDGFVGIKSKNFIATTPPNLIEAAIAGVRVIVVDSSYDENKAPKAAQEAWKKDPSVNLQPLITVADEVQQPILVVNAHQWANLSQALKQKWAIVTYREASENLLYAGEGRVGNGGDPMSLGSSDYVQRIISAIQGIWDSYAFSTDVRAALIAEGETDSDFFMTSVYNMQKFSYYYTRILKPRWQDFQMAAITGQDPIVILDNYDARESGKYARVVVYSKSIPMDVDLKRKVYVRAVLQMKRPDLRPSDALVDAISDQIRTSVDR